MSKVAAIVVEAVSECLRLGENRLLAGKVIILIKRFKVRKVVPRGKMVVCLKKGKVIEISIIKAMISFK